jgi:hypothetical protein
MINKKIKTLLLILFILSLASLFIAFFTIYIPLRYSKIPEFPLGMEEHGWVFLLFIPIPFISLALGREYLSKGYKCTKNIIAGLIMSALLTLSGSSYFLDPNKISHNFSYVEKVEEIISFSFPTSGAISIDYSGDDDIRSIALVRFDENQISMLIDSIKNSSKWKLPDFPSFHIYPDGYSSIINKSDYFLIYDTSCNQFNSIISGNHSNHELYYLAYDVDTNLLCICEIIF